MRRPSRARSALLLALTVGCEVDVQVLGALPDDAPVMFVAQGDLGRTLVSCDEGRSWRWDRSFDREGDFSVCGASEGLTCFLGEPCEYADGDGGCARYDSCNCDRHPAAARGLAAGDGWVYAAFGWVGASTVRRSRDLRTWEVVLEDRSPAGIAFGDGTLLAGGRVPARSRDGGETWESLERLPVDIRATHYDPYFGVFHLLANGQTTATLYRSVDGGDTWQQPEALPEGCGRGPDDAAPRRIAFSPSATLLSHGATLCRSVDGGARWERLAEPGAIRNLLWTGDRFFAFGRDWVATSADGEGWTRRDTERLFDEVAYDPRSGTFVGIDSPWQRWYEAQRFVRSDDGLTWQTLEPESFVRSHAIEEILAVPDRTGVCDAAP